MNAKELKALFPAPNWQTASGIAYKRLEKRSWRLYGRAVKLAGLEKSKDGFLVHLTYCSSVFDADGNQVVGECIFERYRIPLEDCLDCISGNLYQ